MIKQRILLLVLFCFFAGSWAMAQRGQVKGMKSNMTEETKTALNLSSEQRAQLDVLQAQTAKSMESARQEGGDRGAAVREIKEADQAGLEEILTADQLAMLQKIRTGANDDRSVEMEDEERERVRPAQEERTRVRPTEEERERVRPAQEERTRVRPTEEERERVRPAQEERTRVRPTKEEGEVVRPTKEEGEVVRPTQEERTRERVRSEKPARSRDISAEDREKMKAEIDSYREKNIEPATLAQRQKLDAAMSAEDRSRLATLRSELVTDGELRNAQQNKEVAAMVSKYDVEITRLLTEMGSMESQWNADQNIIRAKYMGTSSNDRTRRTEGETEYRQEGSGQPDMDAKVRFLLSDTKTRR